MIFNDISFHDSKILQVTENSTEQSIDFLLEFYTNWQENLNEKKILRFVNVISYELTEIPFNGCHSIMEINYLGKVEKTFGSGQNLIEVIRSKAEIITNAGNRIIEFSECILL